MRKLASSKRVDPKQQDPPTPVTTDWPRCSRILEPLAAIAVVEPAFPPLATAPPVATAGSHGRTAIAATAEVRRLRFIRSRFPALWYTVKRRKNQIRRPFFAPHGRVNGEVIVRRIPPVSMIERAHVVGP